MMKRILLACLNFCGLNDALKLVCQGTCEIRYCLSIVWRVGMFSTTKWRIAGALLEKGCSSLEKVDLTKALGQLNASNIT